MEQRPYDYLFKLILAGDSGVGKSALLRRFVDKQFIGDGISTIGVDNVMKTMQVTVDQIPKTVKLHIWDTAGQDRFFTITSYYARGAHFALLVFALDEIGSLSKLEKWIPFLDQFEVPNRILIGNKCDKEHLSITEDAIDEFKSNHGITHYISTSARTGENVEELFELIATHLCEQALANKIKESIINKQLLYNPVRNEEQQPKQKTCC